MRINLPLARAPKPFNKFWLKPTDRPETNSGLNKPVVVFEDSRELYSDTEMLVPVRKPWLYPAPNSVW
jgi:hypothetical protein